MKLIEGLNELADARDILPQRFACGFYAACNASTDFTMKGGAGCMMSYVGEQYEGKPLRLAVIGMDHGDNDGGDFYVRTNGIINHYLVENNAFNPHYQGVIRTAAAFLGTSGEACDHGCWKQRHCRKASDPQVQDCVLQAVTQPNVVKCVPFDEMGGRTSRATSTMRGNCSNHLLAELKLSKPRICVFHGSATKADFISTLLESGEDLEPLPIATKTSDIAFQSSSLGMMMFFFNHPSRHWLARQWASDVMPCLLFLQERGEI